MLGNFSVGDYFKKEAITWAWELLTSEEWFAMDPEKLYVTVYPKDDAARECWKEVGVEDSHIYEAEDNFWISAKAHQVLILKFSMIAVKK